jgi:H+-transporting ATPase
VAMSMCAYGWLVPALPWRIIGLVWVYNLIWMLIQDVAKLMLYRIVEHRGFEPVPLGPTLQQPLDAQRGLHHLVRRPSSEE